MSNPDIITPDSTHGGAYGFWCIFYKSWEQIYDYNSTTYFTKVQTKYILGAEIPLYFQKK